MGWWVATEATGTLAAAGTGAGAWIEVGAWILDIRISGGGVDAVEGYVDGTLLDGTLDVSSILCRIDPEENVMIQLIRKRSDQLLLRMCSEICN